VWYWGFPQCFGISTSNNRSIYIKVSAVSNGVETEASNVLKISK